MEWIKFNIDTCPKDIEMIFWFSDNNDWVSGRLVIDNEYGIVINSDCDLGGFIIIDFCTHYFIPTKPQN